MNIRSVSNPAPLLGKEKVDASKTIKSDETSEREGNGQQPYPDQEAHRPLTEEELERVVEKIKAHDGIQKNGLIVKVAEENGQQIVKVETPEGKMVKRFVEQDLYFFLTQGSEDEIHLVNKSA